MSKGDNQHAAKHQHGVVPRQEPAAPQTVEQRVAVIEALIESEGGGTVAEQLAKAKARHTRAAAAIAGDVEE